VGKDETAEALEPMAGALAEGLGPDLHSLWWNGNPSRGNAILGPHWRHFSGPEALREDVAGTPVFFPPGAFGQSHPALAEQIALLVQGFVPDEARVLELYAGSGPLGLGLLARVRSLVFNEDSEHGLRGLELGLRERPIAERARAEIAPGPAASWTRLVSAADVVIADPPRRGLDPQILDELCQRPVRRLVYVSCGLASFARDTRRLCEAGLRLSALHGFAIFPYTEHVETVGVFDDQAR